MGTPVLRQALERPSFMPINDIKARLYRRLEVGPVRCTHSAWASSAISWSIPMKGIKSQERCFPPLPILPSAESPPLRLAFAVCYWPAACCRLLWIKPCGGIHLIVFIMADSPSTCR